MKLKYFTLNRQRPGTTPAAVVVVISELPTRELFKRVKGNSKEAENMFKDNKGLGIELSKKEFDEYAEFLPAYVFSEEDLRGATHTLFSIEAVNKAVQKYKRRDKLGSINRFKHFMKKG